MDIRLSICIPTGGTMNTNTVSCLLEAFTAYRQPKHVSFLKGGYSYQNRNIGIQNAKTVGATHILFIDPDMIFPIDTIQKLMDADKDIVGANYHEKKVPVLSTIKKRNKKDKNIPIDEDNIPKELFEVFALGGGMMLVKMDVFDKIKSPYFQAPSGESIHDFMTEDVWFCERVQKAGIKVWCDGSLEVHHAGEFFY